MGQRWLPVVLLAVLAIVMAYAAPRLLARLTVLRRAPGLALLLWQATGLAAIAAALFAGPAAVLASNVSASSRAVPAAVAEGPIRAASASSGVLDGLGIAAGAVSAAMVAVLLLTAHRVGRRLRAVRRAHRELVDLLALPEARSADQRVLDLPGRTAYCLPGFRQRLVLSRGAIEGLDPEELRAVVAHERAHLRGRHDLVLEFFTVLHSTVPRPVRAEAALAEVRLLVEVLADRAAVREVGARPLARALVAMQSPMPVAPAEVVATGVPLGGGAALTRLRLLAEADTPTTARLTILLGVTAITVLVLPFLLLAWAS